jgi:hypothetical protein
MAKVSFVKQTEADAPAPTPVETTTETTPTPDTAITVESITTVAPPAPATPGEQQQPPPNTEKAVAVVNKNTAVARPTHMLGDYLPDIEEIQFPRLNIVQKVGELSNVWPHGAILLDRKTALFECSVVKPNGDIVTKGTPPLEVCVLGLKSKRFVERVEGGGKGATAKSEEEVVKLGGTTSYQEWEAGKEDGVRYFQPYVEALLAVRKPAHINDTEETVFTYESEGHRLSLVLFGMKGTAYTAAAKYWFTQRLIGNLREGYPSRWFSMGTELKKFVSNFAYIPVIKPLAKTTSEFREFAGMILGSF